MKDKVRRDLFLGTDGIERLERLAKVSGQSHSEVTREALIKYEVAQSLFRDTVRSAVINLFRAQIPDGQYDPAEDTRQEEAVRRLGDLLGSHYAAEGIQMAFMAIQRKEMGMIIPKNTGYREVSQDKFSFIVDEIKSESIITAIEECVYGKVEPEMDGTK